MAGFDAERNPELKKMEQEYEAEIDFLSTAQVVEEGFGAKSAAESGKVEGLSGVFLARKEVLATAQILISKLEERGIDSPIQVAFALAVLGQKTASWEVENPKDDYVPEAMPKFPAQLQRIIENDPSPVLDTSRQDNENVARRKFEISEGHASKTRQFLSADQTLELEAAAERAMHFILDIEE